ncbi:hypothetical protein [Ferrimonas sediminum]|uniref:hypothetical protein n=1 Tax=Ferrimonas sediminum TaxID=718193 RepID=UPI00115FFA02|nr:hypothetical protein [Ferrimonas sediminum]
MLQSDFRYFEHSRQCTNLSETQFYTVYDNCLMQVDGKGKDLSAPQAEIMIESLRSCLVEHGISRQTQQECIALNRNNQQMDPLQASSQSRGTDAITLPLPPNAKLVNHMFPNEMGGKLGAIPLTLSAAVFTTPMSINDVAEYYRVQVGSFYEFRHDNGDISFIEGVGNEVIDPATLLEAQLTRPNVQIIQAIDPLTGESLSGAQVMLFYQRL